MRTGKALGMYGESEPINTTHIGRFPANTILTYDDTDYDEVCGGFPIGGQNGNITKRYKMDNQVYGEYGYCNTWEAYEDSGSASRYFYCAKATVKDRDEGLESFELGVGHNKGNGLDRVCEFCGVSQLTPELCHCETKSWVAKPKRNYHPTVKPTELMQYLVRLVSPKGAIILDPFMGSGSTGKAVVYENNERNADYKFIGIERENDYCKIAEARIKYAYGNRVVNKLDAKTGEIIQVVEQKLKQKSLF